MQLYLQHISYAKGKSDAVAKEDGTYKPRTKKKDEEGRLAVLLVCDSVFRFLWFV